MKVDENGYEVTEWNKIYYNGQDFTSIVPSNTGKGYVLAGSTRYGGWLIEVDENGIVNNGGWEINIGNTMGQYIYFNSVIQDDHGGYIIAGRRQYYTEGSETAICIKFDNNGITSAFP